MNLWLSSQRHLYESVEQTLTSLEIAEPEPYEGKGVGEAAFTFEGLLEKWCLSGKTNHLRQWGRRILRNKLEYAGILFFSCGIGI